MVSAIRLSGEEELKSLLMKVKEEREKAGLKLNIQKLSTFGPITSWQIVVEKMETVTDFFLGSKITANGDCSHEIKRHLLLGRKAMTNLDSILKSITLPTKVHLAKSMVFLVYGFSRMDVKVGLWRKLSAEELMLLNCGVGEDSGESLGQQRSNQSILKEISPEAETAILWPPDGKNCLLGKDPDAGQDWRQEEKGMTEDEMVG